MAGERPEATAVPRCPVQSALPPLALGVVLAFLPRGAPAWKPDAAAGLVVDHEPPGCVVAEKYPRFTACFRSDGSLARGRIYFRQAGSKDWFYVEMTGEPPCFEAILPRPRKDLGAIEYFFSGIDQQLVEKKTRVYSTAVSTGDTCEGRSAAPTIESARVVIGSPSGSAPPGFLAGDGASLGLILGAVGGGVVVATLALAKDDEKEVPPATARAGTVPWVSELAVPGGRGWITIDGGQRLDAGPGPTPLSLDLGPGVHRVEGVLTEATGQPGAWRFDLTEVPLVPGSLHTLVGEVAEVGSARIVFPMRGEPGERLVFAFSLKER